MAVQECYFQSHFLLHSEAQGELHQAALVMSGCLKALSCYHATGQLDTVFVIMSSRTGVPNKVVSKCILS